jgi:hypothetical protein
MLKATRIFIAAIAIALVLVPTIKRAQQHVEHRDATRLSIKHSWIGVAPPTKAAITSQHVVVLPALGAEPEPPRVAMPRPPSVEPALHPVLDFSPDPLRGPPTVSL